MPIDEVTIIRMCADCHAEIETMTVKKDNMRLFSDEQVWCPRCDAYRAEVRDMAGRQSAIQQEINSYPSNKPADAGARPA
jgi:hypothetical protein